MNLFEVEKPQVRIECAGQMIESEEIESYKLNPNFTEMVKHFDVVREPVVPDHFPISVPWGLFLCIHLDVFELFHVNSTSFFPHLQFFICF